MSTSGTYSFTVTRDQIIRDAMLNIGKLDAYSNPDAQENTDCAFKLNMMVKTWMGRQDFAPGLKMWTRQRGDLILSSTQYRYALGPSGDNWMGGVAADPNSNYLSTTLATGAAQGATTLTPQAADIGNFTANDYVVIQLDNGDIWTTTVVSVGATTFVIADALPEAADCCNVIWNYTTKGQRPLELVTALLRETIGTDTPLDFMTLQTYEQLPTKVAPGYVGDPSSLYYEAQLTNGQLYIDVAGAQDVTKTIHIVYLRPIQDFNVGTDNPEFPQEWYNALCWGLSRQICPMFNAVWTPDMQANYDEAMAFARESNSERTEIYFQPNQYFP